MDEITKKIRKLRIQFAEEKRKVTKSMKSGTAAANVYQPKWKFFKELLFLDKYISCQATSSNLSVSYSFVHVTYTVELFLYLLWSH